MKIKELTKHIFESIRYGAREASIVEQLDARIGIEFEFHIRGDTLLSNLDKMISDEERQKAIENYIEMRNDTYREDLRNIKKNIMDEYSRHLNNLYHSYKNVMNDINNFKNLFKDEVSRDIFDLYKPQSIMKCLEKLAIAYNDKSVLDSILFEFSDFAMYIHSMQITNMDEFVKTDYPDFYYFFRHYDMNDENQSFNETEGIIELYDSLKFYSNLYRELEDAPESSINEIVLEFLNYIENDEVIKHFVSMANLPVRYESHYILDRESILEGIDPVVDDFFDDPKEASISFVKSVLPQYLDMSLIEDVTPDSSIKQGAEVVTKPLRYKDAMEVIDIMFEFIEEYGSTSNSTGLHMNVSLSSGMTLNDIDPLIFLLLLDNKHIDDNFGSRRFVDSMLDYLFDHIENAAYDYLTNGPQSLINLTRGYIPKDVKYQQINFSHIGFEPKSDSRIEYRAPGGDYIEDIDLIKSELTRLLYMLNATINYETVYPRERMLKDLFRLWDRASMKSAYKSFSDVINDIAIQHGMRKPKAGVRTP